MNHSVIVEGQKMTFEKAIIHPLRTEILINFDENNETKMYEAIGFVNFEFKHDTHSFRGRANKVIYDMFTLRYILSGKAVISDNDFAIKRHISGDKIIVDMFTGRVKVKGAPLGTKFFIKLHDYSRLFGI